jgi:hypothetical protein
MSTTATPATPGAAASTAAADFAQPIYLEEANSANAAAAGSSSASAASLEDQIVIDLNDPNLLMQELDTNPDVDPYAAPPPLPDGRWRVKVKQQDVKNPSDGQPARYAVKLDKQTQQPYAYTALEATVLDPTGKNDGMKLHDYFVSTRPARNGGIPIVRLLTCLKVQLPPKVNAKVLMDELLKALASEPELEVDTVWEGGMDQADQERFEAAGERQPRVLGQHRFPQNGKGEPQPEMTVETKLGKVNLRARPRINGYFPLGSAKAAGMELGAKK